MSTIDMMEPEELFGKSAHYIMNYLQVVMVILASLVHKVRSIHILY